MYAEAFTPSRFEAEHTAVINGQSITYKVISEDHLLYDQGGSALGSMFTFTYLRTDVENPQERPVIFVFNGGPGSSSMWMHIGLFGPIAPDFGDAALPQVSFCSVRDNPLSLLDTCDMVMIDPVGTGFGRLLDAGSAGQFFDVDKDAAAFCTLIEKWLDHHHRWQSPRYLAAESYGVVRAAVLVGMMSGRSQERLYCVPFDGLILLGNTLGNLPGILENSVEPSVLALPTLAAIKWYHEEKPELSLREIIDEAYAFAGSDYLWALFQGSRLTGKKREEIKAKLAYFTGLTPEYLEERCLRIDPFEYTHAVLAYRGLDVGCYDGRYTMEKNPYIRQLDVVGDDPSIGQYAPPFIAAMNGEVRKLLNIDFDREYIAISHSVGMQWNFPETGSAYVQHIAAAMRRNNKMRLFFGSGCYDLITLMGIVPYLCAQAGLPQERVTVKEYPSGHMCFIGKEAGQALSADLRAFIRPEGNR